MSQTTQFTPVRIQRSRRHKFTPPNLLPTVYVGRPSLYGNPFKKGVFAKIGNGNEGMKYLICLEEKNANNTFRYLATIEDAVTLYKEMLDLYPLKATDIKYLRNKNLSCWCKVGEVCHADVLLKIVNC